MSHYRRFPLENFQKLTRGNRSTWFLVPIPKDAVQTALKQAFPLQKLSLLPLPTDNKALFPNGFPTGMHPVLANVGVQSDIQMSALQIDGGLKGASVYATYISREGKPTPLAASLSSYIAGEHGPLPDGLVPAVASPLLFAGTPIRLGEFDPDADAYMLDGGGALSTQSRWAIVPNPISGPGVYSKAVDFLFRFQQGAKKYSELLFKTLINQPIILPSGKCQRNQYYFANASAEQQFVAGQVRLGPGASGYGVLKGALMEASPGGDGVYEDQEGFRGKVLLRLRSDFARWSASLLTAVFLFSRLCTECWQQS